MAEEAGIGDRAKLSGSGVKLASVVLCVRTNRLLSFEAVSFSAFLVLSWPVFEVSRGREVLGAFWPEAERLGVYGL